MVCTWYCANSCDSPTCDRLCCKMLFTAKFMTAVLHDRFYIEHFKAESVSNWGFGHISHVIVYLFQHPSSQHLRSIMWVDRHNSLSQDRPCVILLVHKVYCCPREARSRGYDSFMHPQSIQPFAAKSRQQAWVDVKHCIWILPHKSCRN